MDLRTLIAAVLLVCFHLPLSSTEIFGVDFDGFYDDLPDYEPTEIMTNFVTPVDCSENENIDIRPINGECVHPENLGASFTPISRLLPAVYGGNSQDPRILAKSGDPLPSARVVSRTIQNDEDLPSEFTIMLMQWGQFMDHDIVNTPFPIEDTREHVCCGPDNTLPTGDEDEECFPILFDSDDNFVNQCMFFFRSEPVKDTDGSIFLPRENTNAVTSFVDASVVYGSTDHLLEELRDGDGHGPKFQLDSLERPIDNGKNDCERGDGPDQICYLAGDERVNEHAGLTAIHTVFMRKHNQWADELQEAYPDLDDEEIFQTVRSVIIAVTQKVMFNDWLPIILGEQTVLDTGLYSPRNERSSFDENFKPGIFSGFSTGVFRFGHTLIPKEFFLGNPQGNGIPLRDMFFKPWLLFENFDEIVINLIAGPQCEDRAQTFDRHFTEEITEHLFENQEGEGHGFDLVALNIQRGRDHGIPPYNDFREECGLPRITSFSDSILGDAGPLMSEVYQDPDDIELFIGGVSESSGFNGGIVGETFNCLISKQMQALKFGDRFFFTHDRPNGFTQDQLDQIHDYTLSHLMCETTAMTEAQPDPFRVPGPLNIVVDCEEIQESSLDITSFV